jgi:hypothetical protein
MKFLVFSLRIPLLKTEEKFEQKKQVPISFSKLGKSFRAIQLR